MSRQLNHSYRKVLEAVGREISREQWVETSKAIDLPKPELDDETAVKMIGYKPIAVSHPTHLKTLRRSMPATCTTHHIFTVVHVVLTMLAVITLRTKRFATPV